MNDLTSTVQAGLQIALLSQVRALNLGVSDTVLQGIVSRVAAQTATDTTQQVHAEANNQLNVIPRNLIGVNNPVNLVSQNLSPRGLTSTLTNPLQTQLTPGLTSSLITSLQNELTRSLPPDKLKLINFANFSTSLNSSLTPTVNGSVTTALSGFSSSLFNNSIPQVPVLQNVAGLFGSLSPTQALDAVDNQFVSSTASKYLTQAKTFDVNSNENQEKLIVTKVGFTDPNANYPTKEYAGGSETNKLAQGDVKGTIVQKKNSSRMTGAKLPGGTAWDQPESAFKGQYPYNKVTQTESGHIIEVDDTPGAERLHIYHTSGTFIEIDSNGSMVRRTVGSSYEIIDRNGKISIAGKADISINGACNIYVGNDASIEVEGDVNLTCHNDITAQAGGTLNLSATEEVNITGGSVNIQAFEYANITSNVQLNLHATSDINILANASIFVEAVDVYTAATTVYNQADDFYHKANVSVYTEADTDINQKAGGDIKTQAAGVISNKAAGDVKTQAGGAISNKAAGNFAADGSAVHLNSGYSSDSVSAEASKESLPAELAGVSNIGVLSGRSDPQYIDLVDPTALTLADAHSVLMEEATHTEEEYKAHRDLIITSGFATATGFGAAPIVIESESVQSTQSIVVPPADSLKSVKELPGNYKLSPNFTLEMLSSKAALTKDFIEASEKLSYGEIVYNLQAVALNVLEPLYNLYPNLIITSAYRKPSKSIGTSQHPLGQAVDCQFKGISKSEYYTIATKLAKVLSYDQMLLEYCNYTNNPWIHISFTLNNRNQVSTFFNHAKHSDGLTNLA